MKSINISFPIEDSPRGHFFKMNNLSKDALSSNLILLLTTDEGERFYEPNYGVNLRRFLFEPTDDLTISDIEQHVREKVDTFIPQLKIKNLEVLQEKDAEGNPLNDNQLTVIVDFIYSEDVFNQTGRIEIVF